MTREELIARLGQLDASDRGWLLGELPPALRHELAQMLSEDEPPAPAAAQMPVAAPASSWESLDADRVADALHAEPAWLVSAALRATEPRWRERVLAAWPVRRRHEIDMADRMGRPLGSRAAHLVLADCRARLSDAPSPKPARGGFAALVDQMRGRFA